MVEELLPKGRALVPTKVKEDLLARIKNYLENDADYKRLTGYWRRREASKKLENFSITIINKHIYSCALIKKIKFQYLLFK